MCPVCFSGFNIESWFLFDSCLIIQVVGVVEFKKIQVSRFKITCFIVSKETRRGNTDIIVYSKWIMDHDSRLHQQWSNILTVIGRSLVAWTLAVSVWFLWVRTYSDVLNRTMWRMTYVDNHLVFKRVSLFAYAVRFRFVSDFYSFVINTENETFENGDDTSMRIQYQNPYTMRFCRIKLSKCVRSFGSYVN